MIETAQGDAVDAIVPDFALVGRSGAEYEWTFEQYRSLNDERQDLIRQKVMPATRFPPQKILMALYWLTAFGVLMCMPIVLSIARGEVQGDGGSIVAGMILGATGVGVASFASIILVAKRRRYRYPLTRFEPMRFRVGIDRGVLWIFDEKALRVAAGASAFSDVVQIGDVIVAYVTPAISYGFPRAALDRSVEGRKVVGWFEANWPAHTGANAYRYRLRRASLLRRVARGLVTTVCVFGFGMVVVSVAVHLGNVWQATEARKAEGKLSRDAVGTDDGPRVGAGRGSGAPSLSGPGASEFLDRLTHPGSK